MDLKTVVPFYYQCEFCGRTFGWKAKMQSHIDRRKRQGYCPKELQRTKKRYERKGPPTSAGICALDAQPHEKLWCAVILQAWNDAFTPRGIVGEDAETARFFLFSWWPEWVEWRNTVCDMAGGLCGDDLRAAALKFQREGKL